jgi:hypothetical protein
VNGLVRVMKLVAAKKSISERPQSSGGMKMSKYDVGLMVDEFLLARDMQCVAYTVDDQREIQEVLLPLVLGEVRKRRIMVTVSRDRITNDKGGYLFFVSSREPNWEERLRGRNIIGGNVPHRFKRIFA